MCSTRTLNVDSTKRRSYLQPSLLLKKRALTRFRLPYITRIPVAVAHELAPHALLGAVARLLKIVLAGSLHVTDEAVQKQRNRVCDWAKQDDEEPGTSRKLAIKILFQPRMLLIKPLLRSPATC